MSRNKMNSDNAGKTVTLIALGNAVLAPLYWVDARIGLSAALAATAAFLYSAHEIGKKRRPIENGINNMNSFFGGNTEVDNTINNIIAGGGAIFDGVMPSNPPSKH